MAPGPHAGCISCRAIRKFLHRHRVRPPHLRSARQSSHNTGMHPPIFHSKNDARAWSVAFRASMTPAQRTTIGARITERLTASPQFSETQTVLAYVGAKDGELDTRPLIECALEAGKKVLVPITKPRGVMLWSRLGSLADLVSTPRGLQEPHASAIALAQPASGLCIVPGLCFRHDGHRIGFGAGYYDRFLATFAGAAIALAPDALTGVQFPIEPHDQPVSAIFTESTEYAAEPLISG